MASWMSASEKSFTAKPPCGKRFEQAFFLQPHQRHADGRARRAQALDQRQLGDARAGLELATQDQLAQPQLHAHRLRRSGTVFGDVGDGIHHAARSGITPGRSCAGVSARTMVSISRRAHIEPASMFRL